MTFIVGGRPTFDDDVEPVVSALGRSATGTLGHITDFGFARGLQPITRPSRLVGLAFTVRIPSVDVTAIHYALGLVEPGEVIVIDTSGENVRACWGGVVTQSAIRAALGGAVIDGPITDWDEVSGTGFPVWARGTSSLTGRRLGSEGAVQVPIQVGGAVVFPGDIVFADSDGVFFVQRTQARAVAEAVLARERSEVEVRGRLETGIPLAELSGAREQVERTTGETT